ASESTNISDLETPVEEVPVSEVAAEPELPPEDGFSENGEIPNFEGTTEPDLPSEDSVQENNYEQKISDETDSMDDKIARISVVAETMASSAYVYSGEKTEHSSSAEIVLDNTKGAFNNLKNWHLLITEMSVNQIEGQGGQVIELSGGVYNQGFIITGEGEQINFANVDKVEVPVSEIDTCTLFVSATVETSLDEQAGQVIELENSNGILLGPSGVKLTFSHVNKITVPNAVNTEKDDSVEPIVQKHFEQSQQPIVSALSQDLPSETTTFIFDENSGEKTIQGGTVLVKTGYSLYGWNVHFDNGLTMSLADVRTFESLNNALPSNKGEITYKNAKLIFENVENIKVYEQPAYCGYSVNS
ncbi:MAG: hypothetical protein MJ250_07340, partial [Alphaproteobacteria bacterium]|nr:hypothetical protein [Alphaproteobacteria bacterium]